MLLHAAQSEYLSVVLVLEDVLVWVHGNEHPLDGVGALVQHADRLVDFAEPPKLVNGIR